MEELYHIENLQNELSPTGTNKNWRNGDDTVIEKVKFTGYKKLSLKQWPAEQLVIIKGCHFSEKTHITGHFWGDILFQNCKFSNDVIIDLQSFDGLLKFSNCDLDKDLAIRNGKYKNIFVDARMEKFLIHGGSFERLDFKKDKSEGCNSIQISFYGVKGTINIDGVKCKSISFADTMSKDTDLSILNSICAELSISRYVNDGRLKLFNVNITDNNNAGKATIHQSNLSKAEFYNINYGKHAEVDITESFIADINFVKVNWPKSLQKMPKDPTHKNIVDRTMLFKQLKSAYNKQGDAMLEHDFHALEMYSRLRLARKELFLDKKKGDFIARSRSSKSRLRIFQDWVVLSLSHISSRFGMDWIRPLVFAFLVNIPLFTWMVATGSVKNIVFDPSPKGMIASISCFPQYLYYLYPFHHIEYKNVNISIVADLLIRAVTGYCVYNFVRATRRFVK